MRQQVSPLVDPHVEAITSVLHIAAGTHCQVLRERASLLGFPSALDTLTLNEFITLVCFLGTMSQGKHAKRSAYVPTDLTSTLELLRGAGRTLVNWPNGFHGALSEMLESGPQRGDAITLKDAFGNHFMGLIGLWREYRFLLQAFEDFLACRWPGVIRKQHRTLSDNFHEQYPWVTAQEAKHISKISIPRLVLLVRTHKLNGKLVIPQGGCGRKECWIRRSSLIDFINHRDTEQRQYLPQEQVAQILGLSAASVAELGQYCVLSSVNGPEKHLPRGKYYENWDVRRLNSLCLSLWGCKLDVQKNHQFVSLTDARQKLLGGGGSLARVFDALVSGSLLPVGHVTSSSVATFNDLVFTRSDLSKYATRKLVPLPKGFIDHKEAARRLGTNTEVVRNLAAAKLLSSPPKAVNRFRLVSSRDVEWFGFTCIGLLALAAHFKTRSDWVSRYLKAKNISVLAIRLPGKGKKLFVNRSDVAGIVIPRARRARRQPKCSYDRDHSIPLHGQHDSKMIAVAHNLNPIQTISYTVENCHDAY